MPKRKMSPDIEHAGTVILKPKITLPAGCAIIIGTIIGSGIFISPVGVLQYSNSVGLSLVIWALCGIFSVIGALCYAELGTSILKSGGDYAYIKEAFGPLLAFLRVWMFFLVISPTGNAIIALICANYILQPFFVECEEGPPAIAKTLLAAACILILTFINCASVTWATQVQNILTVAKLLALAVIILAGVANLCLGHVENFKSSFENSTTDVGDISLAFYIGLFAYGGWNNLNYATEEMKDLHKNLPRAIIISVPLVTLVYVFTNVAYFTVMTPLEMMANAAVAVTFADRVLGVMSWVIPLSVAASCFGALSSSMFCAGRIFFVGARDGQLPAILGMISIRRRTPLPSIIMGGLVSSIMLVAGDVFSLINYFSFANWLFIGMAISALIWLRYKEPNRPRPFTVPLVLPIIFVLTTVFIVAVSLYAAPADTGIGAAITLSGIPVYFVFIYWKNKPQFMLRASEKATEYAQMLFECAPQEKSPGYDL